MSFYLAVAEKTQLWLKKISINEKNYLGRLSSGSVNRNCDPLGGKPAFEPVKVTNV